MSKAEFNEETEHYFTLAVQTVLRQNRHRLKMLQESHFHPTLLKELSRDIVLKAQWFKELSETLQEPYGSNHEHEHEHEGELRCGSAAR